MRTAMRPRYYCDHCNKGNGSPSAMRRHERGCTANPNRVCGMCAMLADKAVADAAKKPAQPVRRWLSWAQAWATLGLLVWFGHIATGLAWLWVMVVIAVHQDKVKTQRNAPAPASAVGA